MASSLIVPVAMYIFGKPMEYIILMSLIAVLVVAKHVPNIKRLVDGEEHKIGERTKT